MAAGGLNARRLGLLALGVLLAHAVLLRGVHEAFSAGDRARDPSAPDRPPASLAVRAVAPVVLARAEPAVVPPVPDDPPRRAAPPARPVATGNAPRPPAAAVLPATPASHAPPNKPPIASAAETPAAPPAGDLPVYRTLPPPAFAFGYDLRRGALTGSAELQWTPRDGGYRARLVGTQGGAPLLAWESTGAFDGAGLAPERYTDRRRGGGTQAANFQRAAGKVTFSGPAVEHALPPGAQDRLSWMLQLAAVAAADPSLVGPGGRVSLLVVGARGDADVWTFVHVGEETFADGGTPALRLLREPRRPYDTRVEVWLDPARHYLPLRARLSGDAGRDELQLVLRDVLQPP